MVSTFSYVYAIAAQLGTMWGWSASEDVTNQEYRV